MFTAPANAQHGERPSKRPSLRALRTALIATFAIVYGSPAAAEAPSRSRRGQPLYVVVLATERDEHLDALAELAHAVDRELVERGVNRIPFATAAEAFRQRNSSEPQTVTPDDLEFLATQSARVIEARKRGLKQEVATRAQALYERLEGLLPSLNRDAERAREYFNICAAHVRVLVDAGNLDRALAIARECRSAVPDLKLDPKGLPPSVYSVLQQAQPQSSPSGVGQLIVESDPPGCTVHVEGRPLGTTPYTHNDAVNATVRVQVECENRPDVPPGRVHSVVVHETPTRLFVDTKLERAVTTTDDLLRLRYRKLADSVARRDACSLAQSFTHLERARASDCPDDVNVLLLDWQRGQPWLRTVGGDHGAAVPVVDRSPAGVARAVADWIAADQAAREGVISEPLDDEGRAARIPEPPTRMHDARAVRSRRWVLPTGLGLLGAGAVTFVVGLTRHEAWTDDAVRYRKSPSARANQSFSEWTAERTTPVVLAAAGAALASAGAGLVAARAEPGRSRWLAPLVFGLGAVPLLAVGIRDLVRADPCTPTWAGDLKPCMDGYLQQTRGALLLVAATPALAAGSMLMVRALTSRERAPVSIGFSLAQRSAVARLHLRF